jgi:hypothetical protein
MIRTLAASVFLLATLAACGGDDEGPSALPRMLDDFTPTPSASPTPTGKRARPSELAFCYSGRGADAAGRRMFAQIRIKQGDGIAITGTYLVGPSIDAGKTHNFTGTLGDGKLNAVLTIAGKEVPMTGIVDAGQVLLKDPQPELIAKFYEVGCD